MTRKHLIAAGNALRVSFRSLLILLGFAILAGAHRVSSVGESAALDGENGRAARTIGSPDLASTAYLPLIQLGNQPQIQRDAPIWTSLAAPQSNEVSLFRKQVSLPVVLEEVELHIFADTRYEVWVDGVWLGRGPARFSRKTHEYDIYPLGSLAAGEHLIAVLVQWAPNIRRSESTTPYLQAHLQGHIGEGGPVVAGASGPDWKAVSSTAWNPRASLVHLWELIGPTELLDLRLLSANWMAPAYSDSGWGNAVVKDLSTIDYLPLVVPRLDPGVELSPDSFGVKRLEIVGDLTGVKYRARSIPLLVEEQVPVTFLDAGELSVSRRVGYLASNDLPNPVRFSAGKKTPFTLEIVTPENPSGAGGIRVLLDGNQLDWTPAGPTRPDVYLSSGALIEGKHSLHFLNLPHEGQTFAITTQNLTFQNFPFRQGLHAGQRLLLAEPSSNPALVNIVAEDSVGIVFNNLPAYTVIDLGRTVHGRLVAEVIGSSGTVLDVGWDERLLAGTLRPLPYPGSLHRLWNQVDSWILDGKGRSITTIDARAGRYILIAAWGAGPVELRNIRVNQESYPVEMVGEFYSSNPELEHIWQLGVNTLPGNLTDAYADPWRERGQWWGDAYVVDHAARVAYGDLRLLKRGLYFMAEAFDAGRPNSLAPNGAGIHLMDYGMQWVYDLVEYFQLSGDFQVVEAYYPTVADFIDFLSEFENPATGLLDLPKNQATDRAYLDTIAGASRYGQSTALNSVYYGTLLKAAELAELVGEAQTAAEWREKASAVRQAINVKLFMPDVQRYATTLYAGETIDPSVHAQAWPLAYQVVPEGQVSQVAGALLDLLSYNPEQPEVEIFGTAWVLEALGRSGFVPEALNFLEVYYGHLLDSGAKTTWEVYNADLSFTQALSHGWGASPTWFLTTYLLGARWLGPDSWVVAPAFEGVQSVSGKIPLGAGVLHVRWEQASCAHRILNMDSPSDTSGELVVPNFGPSLEIRLDGTLVWQAGAPLVAGVTLQADGIHIPAGGGAHQLVIDLDCSAIRMP
ncbi:MAG TPA: hypothetical protein VJ436_03255 [Anaerolineales bacterium]|nr:hypothetical protein [Anaerolineales bacterium]